jgi:hypothetical protein
MATDWKAKGISNGPLYTFLGGNVQSQFKNTILGALPSGPEVAPSGILWTHDTPQCPDGWFLWSYNPDAYGASRGAFACSAGSAVPFRSDFLNGGQPGQFWIPRGEFFVGGSLFSTKTTCVRYHTAPPTDGTWVVGDIVFNTDPSSNGVLAWQCTAADTPETWTPIHLDRVKTMALANDFTTTNDTATSTNLTFAVGANDLWFVEVTGCISSGDVNGIRVAFSAPTGATVAGNAFGHNTSTTEYVDNPLTTTSLSPAFVTLANNPQLFSASATIMMDGTHTGSITFQAASVMLGQTCTIKAGACMRATRVDAV